MQILVLRMERALSMKASVPNLSSLRLLQRTTLPHRENLSILSNRSSFSFHLRCRKMARGPHAPAPAPAPVRSMMAQPDWSKSTGPVRIVSVVGEASISPLKETPWEEVMRHTADRLKWVDEGFEMQVFTDKSIQVEPNDNQILKNEISNADMLVNISIQNKNSIEFLLNNSKNIANIISFESSPLLLNKLGGNTIPNNPKNPPETIKTVSDAWERQNSDDIRFCILVLINSYIRPVSTLQNLRAKGLSTLTCMVKNCGPQIINCLLDPNCRKAIQCLNSCSPTDQVCNYKCIASYESANLEAFSLCVLQKHNCLELNATISYKPHIPPLETFRGNILNHDLAEDLFIGWLGKLNWSWRVISGQNPAYDQFPCQYQLFYRGKAQKSFWYEPVFQVKTLDGNLIWRRRRYRVKRSTVPGTFYFTVLDNGVVSKEFWTIVDVCEDLRWGLFHYSGAASKAGLSYTGSVLVSPDGKFPTMEKDKRRIELALEKCGIKNWELYLVDNSCCENPPLGIPEGSRLHEGVLFREEILGFKI